MHIERMHEMIEKMTDCTKTALDQDSTMVGAYPIKDVVDMIKDLSEAEYYSKISVAMDEADYGEDYDYRGRKGYRSQPRNSRGQYTSRRGRMGFEPEWGETYMPDMMMDYPENDPRMYYSGNGSRGGSGNRGGNQGGNSGRGSQSRYGFAYDEYMEKRDQHSKSSPEENSKRIELLNDFIEDLEDMAKDVVKGMSPEEKQVWKIKLNKLTSM